MFLYKRSLVGIYVMPWQWQHLWARHQILSASSLREDSREDFKLSAPWLLPHKQLDIQLKPEGGYHHRLCTAIAPFWFSTEHLWILMVPFWLSTDDFSNGIKVNPKFKSKSGEADIFYIGKYNSSIFGSSRVKGSKNIHGIPILPFAFPKACMIKLSENL